MSMVFKLFQGIEKEVYQVLKWCEHDDNVKT